MSKPTVASLEARIIVLEAALAARPTRTASTHSAKTRREVPEHVKAAVKANTDAFQAAKALLAANGFRGSIIGCVYHPPK